MTIIMTTKSIIIFFRKGEAKAVSGHYLLKSGVDFLEGGVDCASGLAERGIQSGPTIER